MAAPYPPSLEGEPLLPMEQRYSYSAARRRRSSLDGLEPYVLGCGQPRRDSLVPALGFSLRDMSTARRHNTLASQPAAADGHAVHTLPRVIRSTLRVSTEEMKNQMMAVAGVRGGRVQVNRLERHGFTTEDLSRVIYDKFKDTDLPEFLDYVELEKRGGLDSIGEIWSSQKYLSFAFLIGCVLFNTSYLISMDWAIFKCFTSDVLERFKGADLTNVTDAYSRLVEENSQTAGVFKSKAMDVQTRQMLLIIAALVATWEMCWILVKVSHSFYIWCLFALSASEYRSFHAIMYFFQKLLPQFSTFSAIKLMARVHPSLIYNEYLTFQAESTLRATWSGQIFLLVWFVLKCTICGLAAAGAFTIKLLAVSVKLMDPGCSLAVRAGAVLALLLQCMGCVIIEIVLQDRLFLFVFGGQDAMYEDIEHAYKNVYEARVARQIWKEFWGDGMRLKAIVLLATFDHYDLQRLLIERLAEGSDIELGPGNELDIIEEVFTEAERDATDEFVNSNIPRKGSNASFPSTPRHKSFLDQRISRRELSMVGQDEHHAGLSAQALQSMDLEQERDGKRAPPPHEVGQDEHHAGLSAQALQAMDLEQERDGKRAPPPHEATSDSQSSVSSSLGMQVVTRYLQDQFQWRDNV